MQEFFQEIEKLREIITLIEQDIARARQVHHDILTFPQADQKAKQQLEDIMNDIKLNANSGKIFTDLLVYSILSFLFERYISFYYNNIQHALFS